MATPISRDTLNKETNARFWAQTGYKPGQRLDPNNPLDKAKMPVWMDIFRKVQAEANAGTLVTTYDRPEVAQPLADAEVASTVATIHVDAASKAPDPAVAQQHAAAAATATQVSNQKLNEAAQKQPPTASPQLVSDSAREAAKTPPPPSAPAADHIAHAQAQNGVRNGFLRPEDDPWDPRYVPKTPPAREQPTRPPRAQPPARPSRSPRERPSRETLNQETNARFWVRTRYKPHQKLDMSIPEDREQAKIWMEIFAEVQREANEGRLTLTDPALIPPRNGVRPPPRPAPPPPAPSRPQAPPPPSMPLPPSMPPPTMQPQPGMQPFPPPGIQPPGMQPFPPPGMQQPGMQPFPPPGMQQPGMQPFPPPGMRPGMQPFPPPGMRQPFPPPGMQQPGMQPFPPPGMQRPGTQPFPPPGMQQPGMQPGMPQPGMQPGMQPPQPEQPAPSIPPQPAPTDLAPARPTDLAPTTEGAPAEGMSTKAKIALAVLGIGGVAGIAYAVMRKPSPSRGRAGAVARGPGATAAPTLAPLPRGGRF